MTTLPNMGIVLPTRGAPGSGLWGDAVDAALTVTDNHDHAAGNGKRINSDAILVDAALTFGGYQATNLGGVAFTPVAALASGLYVIYVDTATGDLYWRTSAGVNVRLTNGASLNVASFIGGIGGDYTAVSAALNYGDADLRYTFRQGGGTTWARIASGEVRIYETSSTDTVYVGLAAPAALASSYTLTLPLALPAAKRLVQVSSTGVLTFENTGIEAATFSGLITASAGVTCAADQHVTVSGTGEMKHGDRVLMLNGLLGAGTNWAPDVNGYMLSSGAGSLLVQVPLLVGDRIKSVRFQIFGNGSADLTTTISELSTAMAALSIGSDTTNNQPASWSGITINVTDSTVTNPGGVFIDFAANAAGLRVGAIAITYDHP
jgi:hypothetical protein